MKVMVLGGLAESLVRFRGRLLAELGARGAEVHAAAPRISQDERTSRALHDMHCCAHDVDMARTGLNPFMDIATLLRLVLLLSREKPTHFLAYTVKPVVYGLLAARMAGVPNRTALITGLGSAFNTGLSGRRRLVQQVVRALYRVSLRGATRVVFQNPDDRALFHRLGLADPARTALVDGSGVPLDEFAEQPLPPQDQCHFLFVGRLTQDKGVQEYIEAARRIRRRHQGAVFHLVGWIDSNPTSIRQSELDQWIANGVVRYHGRLENVRRALAECHVFVLPSRHGEGIPRSALEALATGRPVVTTDAPGCRETVVDGENGFLVPPCDHAELARAMESFLLHPELVRSMGRASRRLAEKRFDVDKVNADMLVHMGIVPPAEAAPPQVRVPRQAVA